MTLETAIDRALHEVPARRHIQSMIVAIDGEVRLERYFRDRRASDLSNIHSITKSLIATLAGIAIADGALTLQTTLAEIFDPGLFDDPRKRDIEIGHLLTMTSGLDADGPHDIDEIADRGESWLAGPLAAPMLA